MGTKLAALRQNIAPTNDFEPFRAEEIEQSIPARFEAQAWRYPERLAVRSRCESFTYAELNEEANRIAHAILERRGEGEEPVALLLDQGAWVIAAIMGALKAGKMYVPLDPQYPRARLAYMIEDAQAGLVVTNSRQAGAAGEIAGGAVGRIDIDTLDSRLSRGNPGLAIGPERGVNIIYTSGTTGKPKGVFQSHRNLSFEVLRVTNSFHVCRDDRLALVHSCSTSASLRRIFPALLNGASVHPLDLREERLADVPAWFAREGITISNGRRLLRDCEAFLTGEEQFPELRLVTFGGEPAYRRDVELYKRYLPPRCLMLINLASTETGSDRQYFIDKVTEIGEALPPVGYATEGTEILLLDEGGREVGPGKVGEIAVKSRYLALGYWRKPELTRQRFLPDPEGGNTRVYLTGDMGRMREDGCLFHLGRKDFQVKVRGYRVETGEVEAALLQVAGVKDAVVTGRKDGAGEVRLVAHLVGDGTRLLSVTTLRADLSARLPDYMIPSFFVAVEAFPRAPGGKVDRQALPAPGEGRPELDAVYERPRTAAEEHLVRIWEELLGVHPVGAGDDFLELGGDSLLAARLFERIERTMGRRLPLTTLSEALTVKGLAAILEEEGRQGGGGAEAKGALVALRSGGSRVPFFCVPQAAADVSTLVPLSRRLGPDQPFYGLQPVGLDGEKAPHTSVEEMAQAYVKEILAFRPHGPYLVGGRCFGGFVAFEMARILEEQGRDAPFVVMLDTSQPPPAISLWNYLRRLVTHHLPRRKALYCLSRDVAERVRTLRWRLDLTQRGRLVRRVRAAARQARRRWQSGKRRAFSGRIMLIRSPEFEIRFPEYRAKWESLTEGGVDCEIVPGAHRDVLREPYIGMVAERLRGWFAELEADGGGAMRDFSRSNQEGAIH